MTSRLSFLLSLALVLGGCATTNVESNRAPTASASGVRVNPAGNDCSVIVYRMNTLFDSLNPVKPHLLVGEEKVATLGVGDSVCLQLPTGKHTIVVKATIMFVPAYTIGQVDVDVSPATSPIYVRYAKEFSSVIPVGATPAVTSRSSVSIATKEQWLARR